MKNPRLSPNSSVWMTSVRSPEEQVSAVVQHLIRRNNIHEKSFHVFNLLNDKKQYSNTIFCLDIGANQGQSIVSFSNVVPAARIVSFEPLPWCVAALRLMKSMEQKFPEKFQFDIMPFALGEGEGLVDLWVPGSPDYMLTSQASVHKSRASANSTLKYLNSTMFADHLDEITVHHFQLNVKPLDHFNFAPD